MEGTLLHVVGARPNFMKAAPVMRALEQKNIAQVLVHTGQHYDENMSWVFFDELGMPKPDLNLGVGSGSHAVQTADVMKRIEPVLTDHEPAAVLVYGDVNSTVAAGLVATKLHIPVAHVEAGLRSFDRTMPEEVNRILTDQISDYLFIHSPEAEENLMREGVEPSRIRFVGNVMIDTLVRLLPMARKRKTLAQYGLRAGDDGQHYVLTTLHRPSNVDRRERLQTVLSQLRQVAERWPVVFPAHPRTRERMDQFGLDCSDTRLKIIDPVGYLDFLCLQCHAGAVVTDSGGIQEETTYLGVPCFTVRSNTERPVTISQGTNRLIGDEVEMLTYAVEEAMANQVPKYRPPEMWDGHASERIAEELVAAFG